MNILAIDCCTRMTNLGIITHSGDKSEISCDLRRRQTEQLPILLEKLLIRHDISLSSLDVIAVTDGPGFYTGIRTGLTYATSLAYALGIKVVTVSSLEVMANAFRDKHQYLVPVIKARQKHLYYAIFNGLTDLKVVEEPQYGRVEALTDEISRYEDVAIIGNDYKNYGMLESLNNCCYYDEVATGISTAELGMSFINDARIPNFVQGNYMRSPDIGPTKEE